MGSGSVPLERFFRSTPSILLKKALLEHRISRNNLYLCSEGRLILYPGNERQVCFADFPFVIRAQYYGVQKEMQQKICWRALGEK